MSLTFTTHPTLGPILADADGKVLYIFTNDEPGESRCYDQCAANWPPLIAPDVPGAPDAIRDQLSLVPRTDGSKQVAYRDRPLYHFVGDTAPGQAAGDGRAGIWFVVREPPSNPAVLNGRGPHDVSTETPTYFEDTAGFFAKPASASAAAGAGVVMIHEWWGLNDNIREMAEILASHGYLVIAVDLFHGNVAETSEEAQAQVAALNQTEANQNMRAAAALLRERGAETVASLGWCFGGGQSLQLALSGEPLSATVIYYGFLTQDEAELGAIDWPVLGIFGEADPVISVASVRGFEQALNNLSVENSIYIYPDVGHAFANPSGGGWAPEETRDAWARTLAFLGQHA